MIDEFLPIVTEPETNCSQHWRTKSRRHKIQQALVRMWFMKLSPTDQPKLPVEITLTRISSRSMDDDNLPVAFKWIRDELSELLIPKHYDPVIDRRGRRYKIKGRQDSDKRIKWLYAQEKGQIKGIRIGMRSLQQDIGGVGIQ